MVKSLSHVRLFVTPWTVARQASLSMGFSRQEYWSELLCCPPEDLPDPGIKPLSLVSPAFAGRFFATETTFHQIFLNIFLVIIIFHIKILILRKVVSNYQHAVHSHGR